MAGAATGIAGALIANFFYTSPTVGETLAILAFVTVSFGGFGSVLGALVAGLIIGVVESLSAYLIGPVYKDVIVYILFVLVLWFRPQGLMGKAYERRERFLLPARWSCWCWPIRCSSRASPVYRAAGRAGAAGGDRRLGLEHRRRLCRPGLGRPRRVLRLRRLFLGRGLHPSRLAADRRRAARHAAERAASPR